MKTIVALVLVCAAAGCAKPQPPAGRFVFHTAGGSAMLLLDTATGQMWNMNTKDGVWVRLAAPE